MAAHNLTADTVIAALKAGTAVQTAYYAVATSESPQIAYSTSPIYVHMQHAFKAAFRSILTWGEAARAWEHWLDTMDEFNITVEKCLTPRNPNFAVIDRVLHGATV
jgi:hypothetical protein